MPTNDISKEKQLCNTFANLIYKDVQKYINQHREEYEAWLIEQNDEMEVNG